MFGIVRVSLVVFLPFFLVTATLKGTTIEKTTIVVLTLLRNLPRGGSKHFLFSALTLEDGRMIQFDDCAYVSNGWGFPHHLVIFWPYDQGLFSPIGNFTLRTGETFFKLSWTPGSVNVRVGY